MPYPMMYSFPFTGFWMIIIWLIFLVIAYLIYKDAEKRGRNGLLWGFLVLIPWVGIIFMILYLVLREEGHSVAGKTTSGDILDERYAKGELTREQYLQMKEDIKRVE